MFGEMECEVSAMKRYCILVTGANGFIGTNLVRMLLRHGNQVIALDRAAQRCRYPEYRCAADVCLQTDFDLLMINGDIRDQKMLKEKIFCYEIDYVIHLAALSTVQMGTEDAEETFSINVTGTETLLGLVRDYRRIRGFLYASTDKVYGKLQKNVYRESDPLNPIDSPYDRSKAQADEMVRRWSDQYQLHGIVLRFCNVYGEYDLQSTRIIPGSIRALMENRPCTLRVYRDEKGNIQNYKREFLYVGDLCEGIWDIIQVLDTWNREPDAANVGWGEAFNMGAKQCRSIEEVIENLGRIIGRTYPPRVVESGEIPEIEEQCMDYAKVEHYFQFTPKTPFEEGLNRTAAWWREHLEEKLYEQ